MVGVEIRVNGGGLTVGTRHAPAKGRSFVNFANTSRVHAGSQRRTSAIDSDLSAGTSRAGFVVVDSVTVLGGFLASFTVGAFAVHGTLPGLAKVNCGDAGTQGGSVDTGSNRAFGTVRTFGESGQLGGFVQDGIFTSVTVGALTAAGNLPAVAILAGGYARSKGSTIGTGSDRSDRTEFALKMGWCTRALAEYGSLASLAFVALSIAGILPFGAVFRSRNADAQTLTIGTGSYLAVRTKAATFMGRKAPLVDFRHLSGGAFRTLTTRGFFP